MDIRPIDANALANEIDGWSNRLNPGFYRSDLIVRDALVCVQDYIAEAPTLDCVPCQQWISVKDGLPEAEKEVLCYLGNSIAKSIVVAFVRDGEWRFDGWPCPTVTHWMMLPEAPKEE